MKTTSKAFTGAKKFNWARNFLLAGLAIVGFSAISPAQAQSSQDQPDQATPVDHLSAGAPIEARSTEWGKVVESFREGKSVDVRGASGDLDYDPATEETSGDIETWRIEDGEIRGIDVWSGAARR